MFNIFQKELSTQTLEAISLQPNFEEITMNSVGSNNLNLK